MHIGIKNVAMLNAAILMACSANTSDAQIVSDRQTVADTQVASDIVTSQPDLIVEDNALSGWTVRADESALTFTAKQTGNEFTGQFKTFSADIIFDPENLGGASVKAVIDMSSFDAGNKDRNEALPGKEWFAVKTFPQAIFEANEFNAVDGGYVAKGSLTLRGVSLPVALPFDLSIEDGVALMSGELVINRTDYSVGTGIWAKGEWVDLDVKIGVSITADAK